ncbi:MAG: hypothetical protein NPINA01_29890 [Nitrospinaceae bacterium]|nr:MAG: hypothetical protein NPINA01_29890 [Nitrospinaceae bacterium]
MQEKFKNLKLGFVFLISSFLPGVTFAAFPAENLLQDVSSDVSESGLTVRFEFDKPVLKPGKPVFDSKSVRLEVSKASVRPTKRFYYTGDSRVPQIYVSQVNGDSLSLQFVLGEKLPNLRENFQVEDQGKSLVFHIFKREEDVLSEFLARAKSKVDLPEEEEEPIPSLPDENVLTNAPGLLEENHQAFTLDKVAVESPEPLEPAEQNMASTPSIRFEENKDRRSEGPLDLVSVTVKTFSMFALVLALMFLIFYLFKKFVLKNSIFGGNEKFVRVLGTGFLGPKKNIVLVEVAGEILVLGISNDNITLLTHIQDPEKIEKIKANGKEANAGKFWKPPKTDDPEPQIQSSAMRGAFSNYLKQFSSPPTEKEKTVEEVTDMIRKNLGKLKTL